MRTILALYSSLLMLLMLTSCNPDPNSNDLTSSTQQEQNTVPVVNVGNDLNTKADPSLQEPDGNNSLAPAPPPTIGAGVTTDHDGTRTEQPVVTPHPPVVDHKLPTAPSNTPPPPINSAPAPAPPEPPASETNPPHTLRDTPNHALWDRLLQQHVNQTGGVDYEGMKRDVQQLDDYLHALAATPPSKNWSREQDMAYWINLYNAATVRRIVKDYPITSIRDLDGGKPWDKEWINVGDNSYSLNQIEHDILRARYQDPRVHFALNCAAQSCPPLLNQAYTGAILNAQLEAQTRAFINNPKFQHYGKPVKLSPIFDWYGSDFGDVRLYINTYLTKPLEEGTEIQFNEYDWSLNKS